VHFQTEEIWVVMRLRIDGVLQTVIVFKHSQFQKYLMKIKYMSWVKMNISKTMQDGRFDFDIHKDNEIIKIDVRVSVLPWLRWESIVLRYLDASKGIMDFQELGCESWHSKQLEEELHKNYGLILITWPTGSGKTTTVYSLLNHINTPSHKIITLEDPVEYEMPGIEQSQINVKEWYTFESGLKGILRHDPDVIMVWEIRTLETAEMAVNAALTGHLVISTLHTNSAVEAINRLLNMWVKPFMLAASLNVIIWQRLIRKVAKPREVEAPAYVDKQIQEFLTKMKTHNYPHNLTYDGIIYQPDKRVATKQDWYRWRVAVYEVLQLNNDIKKLMLDSASNLEIMKLVNEQWFLTMKDNAYIKMLEWVTSMEEVERVLS
jgi:type IV pilus assembly protein PilB